MRTEDRADNLAYVVTRRLRAGRRVRRQLRPLGRLQIDHPVPFLCVYRRPGHRDEGTEWLVAGEGSYLIAGGDESAQAGLGELAGAVLAELSAQFGAVLLLELWAQPPAGLRSATDDRQPSRFRVRVFDDAAGRTTVATLARSLRCIRVFDRPVGVRIVRGQPPVPPGMPPLITTAEAQRLGVLMLGIEVPVVYQAPGGGDLFPSVLRRLHRDLSAALKKASFRFAHLHTTHRPEHYLNLGPRTVLKATLQADARLAEVGDALNLLLAVTPLNAAEAWDQFRAGGYRAQPTFRYRLLPWDPDVLKRKLYAISLERVEDPALAELLRDKREELDRQIMLLHDRNTERFLYGSLQLYGGVGDDLLGVAEDLLAAAAAPRPAAGRDDAAAFVGAAAFAARAREEIARYRRQWPQLSAEVEVRDDVPGVLVSKHRLLIDQNLRLDARRVEPLIHHEVGTHVLTYCNASAQPLALLAGGLPGYDELQEGTAVLAEYLTGGLGRSRLRLLAARVVAVRRQVAGHSFPDVFQELCDSLRFRPAAAFTIAMRVFRGGGFTKDAAYLRGLASLLQYLARSGDLDLLFLGKVSESSLPVLRELRWRGVLKTPPLRPHYLQLPLAVQRLDALRRGMSLADLLAERECPS